MKYFKLLLLVFVVLTVFTDFGFSDGTKAGRLYEQVIPTSYTNPPMITLFGKTSITTSENLYIYSLSTYCSTCTPFYYWWSDQGALMKQSNPSVIKWIPPNNFTGSKYFTIYCTIGDGKGLVAKASHQVLVTNDGGTSIGGSDLVDPFVSNVRVTSSLLTVGEPTTIYWDATDDQTPPEQLKMWIQYKVDYVWETVYFDIDNTGSIAWTPLEAGNDMKIRVCAFDAYGNQSAWGESNTFNVLAENAAEPPTSTFLYDPGVETPNSSIDIKWRKIIDSNYQLNVNYYELQYAPDPGFSGAITLTHYDNSDPGNIYSTNIRTVGGLQDNTHYYFRVRGVNDTAVGPWSNSESILINLEYLPYFNTSYQYPANGAVGVSKTPLLQWEAHDNDGDYLDYYVMIGTDPGNLYTIRAFNDPESKGQNWFDFAIEHFEPLKPNTTYYWKVKLREDGRFDDYYGGEYISSPLWSFTTLNSGPDLDIINAVVESEVKPGAMVRFKVTVKNLGSETANRMEFMASYIKNGVESPFRTCIGYMTNDLAPGQEEIVNVDVQFRTYIIENNGLTYDNILVSGESQVKLSFNWNHPQDMNWDNNWETVDIYYEDAGGPVIDYFDLREHGSMYLDWVLDFWARMGEYLVVIVNAHDDVKVARFVVQQRYHQSDAWTTLYDQTNDSQTLIITQQGGYSNGFVWPVPTDIEPTDDAQFKVILYDDKNNITERVSEPFSIVSNRLEATIEPLASTYKVGETLQFNINCSSDNTIIRVETILIHGSHSESGIYSDYNESGVNINNPCEWNIPGYNYYVSENCYLRCVLEDNKGNILTVLSNKFQIMPDTELPSPFNEAVVIYNDEFAFPVDALYKQQNRFVEFVTIDENNLTHLVLKHNYSYYQDTAPDYNEDTYVYENNKYYITYDAGTSAISQKVLICNKDYDVVDFDLMDGIPYVLLKDSKDETLYYSQKSGSSFTSPIAIENSNIPKLAGSPVLKSSVGYYNNMLSSPERHVLLNGYLWRLDIFTTRIYRHSFNNGIIGPEEYFNIDNNEYLESYRVRPVTSGNIIYCIDAARSKMAKVDTSTGYVQSFGLPFSTSSMSSKWNECNVALGEFNGKVFLFGNGRVYEFVGSGFIERCPIAYSFDGQNADYSTTNWSNVYYLRTIRTDNKLYLLMKGFFFSTAKPIAVYYELLEFNTSLYQFNKSIARVRMNNFIESHSNETGNPDLLYIGNNKVLSVFAGDTPNSNELHKYYAVLKMLDLANGDIIYLGQLPFRSSGPVSLHQDNGNIYILAENRTNYQSECYQVSLQNLENRVKQIMNPHFVQHNGGLFATWAFGHPFDGTWNFAENALNDWLLRRNKAMPIYPSQGIVSNISDEYLGYFTTVGAGHISSDTGKIWSLNTDLTVDQLVYNEGKETSTCAFEPFGSLYVGTLNYYTNNDFGITLLKADYTTNKMAVIPEFNRIAAYDNLIILGGAKNFQVYISKIDLAANQKIDVVFGALNGSTYPYDNIDMNSNKYVAVGWDVYLAVADFSGDIVPPDVNITNTETQIVNSTAITLTWDATDNSNQLDKFEVYKEMNGNRTLLATITDTNTTTYNYTVNESGASEIKFLVIAFDQDGNIGEDSLVLTIITYTVDLTSFTLDKSTVPMGGSVTFNWSANGVDGSTIYTVFKRQSGTTEWQNYFQESGQFTKTMPVDEVPGTYDFKIESGADSIALFNALTVTGDIPVFDYNQFGVSNSGYYSEPAVVTLSWNIQPFSNQNLVTYDVYVNPNSSGYSKIETTTNTFSNYPIPTGITNINWKITANYQGGQYESNEQTSSLTPLTSPAAGFIELRNNNTDNPNVYLEFTPIPGISEYIVTRQDAGGEYLELATITGNNYTDGTVNYSETYEYGILSKYGTLKGLKGVTQIISVVIHSVNSVTILNENFAVIEDTSLTLNYQPNPLDAYEKYEIFWGTDPGTMQSLAVTNARSVNFADLDYDTTYYIQINALDTNNNVTASSDLFVFFTPTEPVPLPAAPSQLSGEMISLSQIELRWTDNDDNELGFMIERKEGPTGTYEQIYVTDRNYYIDSNNITANTTYFYRVRAYNSSGYSDYSNEINVLSSIIKVNSPNGGETWQIDETVTITWEDNISGNVDIILSRDGGTTWDETLFVNTASDGTESWIVTEPASDQCLIKIIENGGSLIDTSNGTFSIVNPPSIPEIERNALIGIYNSTNGDNWTNNSGWKTAEGFAAPGTEHTWYGVTVEEVNGQPHVTQLYLDSNNLSGIIPLECGNFSHLKTLNLSNNNLSGNIPVQLSALSDLERLFLYNNNLDGGIPGEFVDLIQLRQLNLSSNPLLSGDFPSWVVNLENLFELDLGNCNLTGTIPADIQDLIYLKTLILSNNQFTNNIPAEIGNLTSLEYLALSGNKFFGSIPDSFGSLINMRFFYLSDNNISGSIPSGLINMTQLENTATDIGYNGLYTDDENLRQFLNSKDPDWESTQTVAPTAVSANVPDSTSIELSWTPIVYTADNGGYRVLYSETPGEPYEYTYPTSTTDKTTASLIVTGLNPGTTYYFVVQTRTDPHDNNQNTVDSEYSSEVSASLPLAPSITVISPNGGESWEAGSIHSITWTSTGAIDSVIIECSINNGPWVLQTPATANTGIYNWTVPDESSDLCLVRISAGYSDEAPWDVSDAPFSITSPLPASIRVTAPNAGERFTVGSVVGITWASNGSIGDVKIEYSVDNGQTWMMIVVSTANDGSFQWTVPDTPSESCLLRISESDKDQGIFDMSDGGFSIVPAPFITVTSPNGGETWEVGSNQPINWTSSEIEENVKIEYSANGGNSWTTIIASTANTGGFNWTVPNNLSESCFIRVSETDGAPSDISDGVFSIVPPPSITVISPNGSESWAAGSNQLITWSSAGKVENITIEYSPDYGVNWITIVSSTTNDGSHDWKVADNPSDNCLVRITESNVDSPASDTSDARFSITPAPVITISSPNGGEKLKAGTTHNITWTSSQVQEEVKIEYSTDNGTTWASVLLSTSNNGSYQWTVPDNPSKDCLIRVSETDGEPSDVSDLPFSIVSPSTATITVTSPNGGENLNVDSIYQVTWTSTGMEASDTVLIEYSIDEGSSWIVIEPPTVNSGGYEWLIPDNPSENCLLRISGNDSDEGPSDVSDGVFSIVTPTTPEITLSSPNGGESLTAGSTHDITWTSTGIEEGNHIRIEYSIDSGATWKEIIPFTANSGIYSWSVPDDPSDNCLVRISGSDADEGPADQSDAVFSIVSAASVKVTSPNGGEQWETGSTYDITWTFTGITGNIVIDLYNGDSFDFNIGTVPMDTGKFAWQIPENFTTGEEYRVFLHKDSIEDYSDTVFAITDQDPNHPDFNNDGKVDILWRNYASGMNEVWYMNGAIKTGTGNLPAMTDLNWRIAGTGDFNRDGKVDILWRHHTTGQNLVWYMDGVTLTGNANLPIQPDVNWQIVGTGDFNGDGKDDILWRNALEGRNQVWFMNGVIVEKYQGLQSLEGQAWQVVGAGDFNSDGKTDILWRNYSTGSNEVWYMDGSSRIGSGVLLEMADISWQMVGIGDFNLDEETDILWRRYSDGTNMIWYMDGVTRIGYEYIETRSDLNWRIVSNGDSQD
jgi:hypothetical protein